MHPRMCFLLQNPSFKHPKPNSMLGLWISVHATWGDGAGLGPLGASVYYLNPIVLLGCISGIGAMLLGPRAASLAHLHLRDSEISHVA